MSEHLGHKLSGQYQKRACALRRHPLGWRDNLTVHEIDVEAGLTQFFEFVAFGLMQQLADDIFAENAIKSRID